MTNEAPALPTNPVEPRCFFERADWLSFGLTTLLAFFVYLCTLAPEVTLDFSGIYATATYPGSSMPPGHPAWTVYGWLFVNLIPFSNIAWRLGMASAVAGALTCGLIALIVSRVGFLAAEDLPGCKNFSARVICGCVAGLGLGFDGCFWPEAVIPDYRPFNLLLFALTICLLTRWFFAVERKGYLYAAAFLHGLTVSENPAFIAATFAFPFLIALGDRKTGREIFFGLSICLWSSLLLRHTFNDFNDATRNVLLGIAIVATLTWAFLFLLTRRPFSEWKAGCICAVLFVSGIGVYFLLPIFSMTNPPMNWGYPRTVEGFWYVVTRGQYERLNPLATFAQLLTQWGIYGEIALDNFGLGYLIAASIPLFLLRKVSWTAQKWLLGILAVWAVFTLLMLIGMVMTQERQTVNLAAPFFAASHLLLALLAGCGLIQLAVVFGRPAKSAAKETPVAEPGLSI